MEKTSTPNSPDKLKSLGLPRIFLLLVKKVNTSQKFHLESLHSRKIAVRNTLIFKDGSFEVVGNVRLVRIQSIRVATLPFVDIHLSKGKK